MFCSSEDLCLCSLKSLSPCWVTAKEKTGGWKYGKVLFFTQLKPNKASWAAFINLTGFKGVAAAVARARQSDQHVFTNSQHLMSKRSLLLERRSDGSTPACYFFRLGSFCERKESYASMVLTATFWSFCFWRSWCYFSFTAPMVSSFSNEVNPNPVGCCLHIVQKIKAGLFTHTTRPS